MRQTECLDTGTGYTDHCAATIFTFHKPGHLILLTLPYLPSMHSFNMNFCASLIPTKGFYKLSYHSKFLLSTELVSALKCFGFEIEI